MVHPRDGIRSLTDLKAKQYPLRVSVREDPTHSTLVLIEQAFALHGLKLQDIEAWGGRIITCGGPSDVRRRLDPLARGEIDAVFDEGIKVWLNEALAAGLVPLEIEPAEFEALGQARLAARCAAEGALSRLGAGFRYASISAAGRSTPARRCRNRWPTISAARLPRAKTRCRWEKNTGGSALHMVQRDRRRRRWTCRCIPAPSAGIASTNEMIGFSRAVRGRCAAARWKSSAGR